MRRFLCSLLLVGLLSSMTLAALVGWEVVENAESIVVGNGLIAIGPWDPNTSGTATSITLACRGTSKTVTCGIYDNNTVGGDHPFNLLEDSVVGTCPSHAAPITGADWITVNLNAPLAITTGTKYWIVAKASASSVAFSVRDGSAGLKTQKLCSSTNAYAAGDLSGDNPWPFTSSTSATYIQSIYVNYTEAGGATKPTTIFRRRRM